MVCAPRSSFGKLFAMRRENIGKQLRFSFRYYAF